MKSHVLRPLYVVLAVVAAILAARVFVVPADFGIQESGYMYGWHRESNEQDWKDFKVKHKGRKYCQQCHEENYEAIMQSPHGAIQCENCHGAAVDHPVDPEKLNVDKSRTLCLRCHSYLPYPTSGRRIIPGIDREGHYPDTECVTCHNPHQPGANIG